MTKYEITTATGSEEQANLAIGILLKHTKRELLISAIRAEEAALLEELRSLEAEGYACQVNGHFQACWGAAEKLNGYNLTKEQEAAYWAAWEKCSQVVSKVQLLNRVYHLRSKL